MFKSYRMQNTQRKKLAEEHEKAHCNKCSKAAAYENV